MSARILLKSLLVYQAWANDELLEKLTGLDPRRNANERHAALRLVNRIHVVSRIFAAHLTGVAHGYASDNSDETPEPAELRAATAESERPLVPRLYRYRFGATACGAGRVRFHRLRQGPHDHAGDSDPCSPARQLSPW